MGCPNGVWSVYIRVAKKQKNKLGQYQSQTPFSSPFWSVLYHKTIRVELEILVQKIFGQKKFESDNFWVQKSLVQKYLR